ncbi:MAG: hypothetical protein WD906_07965 [Anaerolineales bacterium]
MAVASALAAAVWGDPVFSPRGLGVYAVAAALSVGGIALAVRSRPLRAAPATIVLLAGAAFAIRLAVALVLQRALPAYAYPVEYFQSGYVFQDAWVRDENAWELSSSGASLATSFADGIRGDQYGGMMFLSAMTYRMLSPDLHRPILIVFFTAGAAALAVLFGWAFTAKVFGTAPAGIAAAIAAFYPDGVLLGASQMREPFLILGLGLALWGMARLRAGELGAGWRRVIAGCTLGMVFSPPFAIFMLLVVLGITIWEPTRRAALPRRVWIPTLGIGLIGVALTVRAWSSLEFAPEGNPLAVLGWWISSDIPSQLTEFARASGWADRIFQMTPVWTHLPLATAYGLLQPFLPAALADNTGPLIMSLLVGLRAAGWLVLLVLLLYATGAALRRGWNRLPLALAVFTWLSVVLASYRAVGDQWDNPRYRTIFIVLYAALAGWGWAEAARQRSPWLVRTAALVGAFHLVLLHWYVGRYYHTPRLSLENTLAVSFVAVVLLAAAFTVHDGWRRRQAARLAGSGPAD